MNEYLDKFKGDLHIGESGYPKKVLLTGDQQTYKLTKDLQANFPLKYNWFYAVPGDWHLLKLTAELIIWDGGFKEMCVACGHKKGGESMAAYSYYAQCIACGIIT